MGIMRVIAKSLISHTIAYDSKQGILNLWGMPYFIISNDALANLQKTMIDNFGKEFQDIIFTLGKLHGYNATSILLKKYGLLFRGDYKLFVEQSNLVGVGSVTMEKTDLETHEHNVISKNTPLANSYKKLFGIQTEPVDHYLMGLASGVSMALDGWDSLAIEEKCISMGDLECKFRVIDKSKLNKNDIKNKPIESEKIKKIFKKMDINEIYRHRGSTGTSKMFKFEDGKLILDNVEGLFTAIYILTILNKTMQETYGIEYKKKLKICGKFEGKLIAKKLKKDSKKIGAIIINKYLQKLKPLGFGIFSITENIGQKKSIIIHNKINPYAKQYEDLFGKQKEPIDYYLTGVLEGFLNEILAKKVSVKEISCFAQTGKECLFKATYNEILSNSEAA